MIIDKKNSLYLCQTDSNVFFTTSQSNYEKMSEKTFKTIECDIQNEKIYTSKDNPIHVVLMDEIPFYM